MMSARSAKAFQSWILVLDLVSAASVERRAGRGGLATFSVRPLWGEGERRRLKRRQPK